MTKRDKIKIAKQLGLQNIPLNDEQLNKELRTLLIDYALTKSQKDFFCGNITKLSKIPCNFESKQERIELIGKALKKNTFFQDKGFKKHPQHLTLLNEYMEMKMEEFLGLNK